MQNNCFVAIVRHIYLLVSFLVFSSFTAFAEGLEWKTMGHLLENRSFFQSALIDKETILVFGGFTQHYGNQLHRRRGIVSNTSEIIDVKKRSVKSSARMNVPHAEAACVQMIDSNIIIVSGLITDSTTTRVCEMYDRKTNTWKEIGSLLIGRHAHTATFINKEEILVVGGHAEANYSPVIAEAEIFNISTGHSKLVNDFPAKISYATILESNVWKPGKKIFVGGRTNGGTGYRITTIYSYDTTNGLWNNEGNFPDGVCSFCHTTLGNNKMIVCAGGSKSNYFFSNNQAHRPNDLSAIVCLETENGFIQVGNLLVSRNFATSHSWNNEIFLVLGGSHGLETLSQTEWFDLRSGQSCLGPPLKEPRRSMNSYSFPQYDTFGKQIGNYFIVFGGIGLNDVNLGSIEILETRNPAYIEIPSEEITALRWKKFYSSSQFVGILMLFISALVFALGYLLYQVIQIRKKRRIVRGSV